MSTQMAASVECRKNCRRDPCVLRYESSKLAKAAIFSKNTFFEHHFTLRWIITHKNKMDNFTKLIITIMKFYLHKITIRNYDKESI